MDVGKVAFLPCPCQEKFPSCPSYGFGGQGETGEWDSSKVTLPLALSQVCPRRPEGKVPRTPREEGSSGKATGVLTLLWRFGHFSTQAGSGAGAGCTWEGGAGDGKREVREGRSDRGHWKGEVGV
jgi:hypothetical protein